MEIASVIYRNPVLVDDLFPWYTGYVPLLHELLQQYPEYAHNVFTKDRLFNLCNNLRNLVCHDDLLLFPLISSVPIMLFSCEIEINANQCLAIPCSRHPTISFPFQTPTTYEFLRKYARSWSLESLKKSISNKSFNRILIIDGNVATGRTVLLIENLLRCLDVNADIILITAFDERLSEEPSICPGPRSMVKQRIPDYAFAELYDNNVMYLSHLVNLSLFTEEELEGKLNQLYHELGDITSFWSDQDVLKKSTHGYTSIGINSSWKSRLRFSRDSRHGSTPKLRRLLTKIGPIGTCEDSFAYVSGRML